MGIIGCYDLRLICDGDHGPHRVYEGEFPSRSRRESEADARASGWVIQNRAETLPDAQGAGRAYCRKHAHLAKPQARRSP